MCLLDHSITKLQSPHFSNKHKTPDSFILKSSSFLFNFLIFKNSLLLQYFTTDFRTLCVLASSFPSDVIQSLNLGYTMALHQRQNMHQICRIILTCWNFFSVRVSNERDWSIVYFLFVFVFCKLPGKYLFFPYKRSSILECLILRVRHPSLFRLHGFFGSRLAWRIYCCEVSTSSPPMSFSYIYAVKLISLHPQLHKPNLRSLFPYLFSFL